MSVISACYKVDQKLFEDLKKKRQLTRLIKVINGYEKPEFINLDNEYRFEKLSLDQAWDEMDYIFTGISGIEHYSGHYKAHISQINAIKSQYCFYWEPLSILTTLESLPHIYTNIVNATGKDLGKNKCLIRDYTVGTYTKSGELQNNWRKIIRNSYLEEYLEFFSAYILEEFKKHPETFTTYRGDAMDDGMLHYLLSNYCRLIRFLSYSLYEEGRYLTDAKKDEAINYYVRKADNFTIVGVIA